MNTPANTALVRAQISRDGDKEMDDPNASPVSSCRRNPFGISKSSYNRITKQERFHPYRILRKVYKLIQFSYELQQ